MTSSPNADINPMLPIARPVLGEAEIQAVRRVIESGWVTQGPEVRTFEDEFAAYVGSPHACAVSSCTTALHLALKAVGVRSGDEVVTVSHSFIATANSVRYCGATPVFVDIEPGTFNMAPESIEAACTARTRAILCVHQLGMPCDLGRILAVAARLRLPVVEDAACAIGSEIRWQGSWQTIGRPHGAVTCFSFHPRKLLTTGDGGMLTTANPEYDRLFRLWRQHGMSVNDMARHGSPTVVFEDYLELGYNYRMTDLQAAIGREQLKRLPDLVRTRRMLARAYIMKLGAIAGLGLPQEPEWARSNWQSFCVRLPPGCDQKKVMQALLDRQIASRRGVMCAHREPAFAAGFWTCGTERPACGCAPSHCERLLESEHAQDRSIVLPLFPGMTAEDQDRVVAALAEACR